MRSVGLTAYLAVSRLAGVVAGPILSRRMSRGKEDPARVGERLGRPGAARPGGPLVWLHGASVGEAMSALPLIAAIRTSRPDLTILLTTGTVASARRMAAELPEGAIHQYVPVDTAAAVRSFLDHWRPDLAVWIESELWPRLITETRRRDIPMALVNARLSAKSHAKWRRLPGMARALLSAFGLVLAQDRETVDRLQDLGCPALMGGNLKAAVPEPPCDADTLAAVSARLESRPVWLAASTHPGEEEIVADAQAEVLRAHPDALLILAPRHPERGDAIADLLRQRSLATARRSLDQVPGPDTAVWLADTLGEMGLWYRLAPVSFVGGSLTDRGGHTPFEPALCGSAILHGPDTRNFAPAYAALALAGGALAVTGADLASGVRRLLGAPQDRTVMVAAALDTVHELNPDVGTIAAELLALIGGDRP